MTDDAPDNTPEQPVDSATAEERDEVKEAIKVVRNLGSAGFFGALTIFIPPIGLLCMIFFMKRLQPWIESLGATGAIVFALLMMGLAGLAIMPTQALSVVVGIFFGAAFGVPVAAAVAISGAVGASILAYGWAWVVAKKKVMHEVEMHPKARIVHHALVDRSFWESLGIVTLLRIPPNLPFAASNFIMASMRVNFPAYVLGTLLGMAPRLTVCVMIGKAAGSLDDAKSNPYKFYFLIATIVFAVLIVMIFGHLAKKALAKYDPAANGATRAGGEGAEPA